MDKNIKLLNKEDSKDYWDLDFNLEPSAFLDGAKKRFNKLFLLSRCVDSDIHSRPVSKFQHLTMLQLSGSVKYIFPLTKGHLIFDLAFRMKISKSLKKNEIIEKKEIILNPGETLLIPFGAIYYQEIVTGPVDFYELSEEDIYYREMVTFCGKTILGLPDFDSRVFEKFDAVLLSDHTSQGNLDKLSEQVRLFESIIKLGKTKRTKNAR